MNTKEKTNISNHEHIISDEKNIIEENKLNKKKGILPMHLMPKLIMIVIILVILLVILLLLFNRNSGNNLTTISKSSLQKVIEINELSTVDYIYNATATKYDKNNNAKYYVAYEGTVTAGINFNKIDIAVVEKEKKVLVTIPDVEIHSTKVDMGTMEYIFTKTKYETEDISQEAYKLCKDDLEERVKNENVLYDTAKENAISSVEALIKPWIDTIDDSYSVEFK